MGPPLSLQWPVVPSQVTGTQRLEPRPCPLAGGLGASCPQGIRFPDISSFGTPPRSQGSQPLLGSLASFPEPGPLEPLSKGTVRMQPQKMQSGQLQAHGHTCRAPTPPTMCCHGHGFQGQDVDVWSPTLPHEPHYATTGRPSKDSGWPGDAAAGPALRPPVPGAPPLPSVPSRGSLPSPPRDPALTQASCHCAAHILGGESEQSPCDLKEGLQGLAWCRGCSGGRGLPGGSDGLNSAWKLKKSQKKNPVSPRPEPCPLGGPHSVLPRPPRLQPVCPRAHTPVHLQTSSSDSLRPHGMTAWARPAGCPVCRPREDHGPEWRLSGARQTPEPRPECWQHSNPQLGRAPARHCLRAAGARPPHTRCFAG